MSIPPPQNVGESRRSSLKLDVAAGVSVCVIMIPSVIAYGELAGLPPAHGLYAALAAMVGYALFASSRQVVAGPDAAITILVASAIGPLAAGDPARAAAPAGVLALLGGGLMLLAAGLRTGVVADFLSKPVLLGYLSGAALILVSTQLGKLFGIKTEEHDFFPFVAEVARRIEDTTPLRSDWVWDRSPHWRCCGVLPRAYLARWSLPSPHLLFRWSLGLRTRACGW